MKKTFVILIILGLLISISACVSNLKIPVVSSAVKPSASQTSAIETTPAPLQTEAEATAAPSLSPDVAIANNEALDELIYINKIGSDETYCLRGDGQVLYTMPNPDEIEGYYPIKYINGLVYCVAQIKNPEEENVPYEKLASMKPDGTEFKILCNDYIDFISWTKIDDGWIYYFNHDDEGKLYRIRLDGSGRHEVTFTSDFYIFDGHLFCVVLCCDDGGRDILGSTIYKRKLGGTNKTTIAELKNRIAPDKLIFTNDEILFYNCAKYSNTRGDMFKMRMDGSGLVNLGKDASFLGYNIKSDDWVYENYADYTKIVYKGKEVAVNSDARIIDAFEDWVYYIDPNPNLGKSSAIYRIRTDGTMNELLCDNVSWDSGFVELK